MLNLVKPLQSSFFTPSETSAARSAAGEPAWLVMFIRLPGVPAFTAPALVGHKHSVNQDADNSHKAHNRKSTRHVQAYYQDDT